MILSNPLQISAKLFFSEGDFFTLFDQAARLGDDRRVFNIG